MRSRAAGAVVLLALAAPLSAGDAERGRKPRLELRATPRVSFSPVVVFLTAELRGGDEVEDYYCPEVEWDWDDGGKSARGQDCPPYEAGASLERRFTAEHAYRRAGSYNVKVTMRRATRSLAVASATVHVRPGLGEFGGQD